MALPLTDSTPWNGSADPSPTPGRDATDGPASWPPRLALVPPISRPAPSPILHRPAISPAVHRRRRLGVLIMAGLLVAVGLTMMRTPSSGTGRAPLQATGTETAVEYIVQPGDTLWSIAGTIRPTSDRRSTVDHLAALNGGADLTVGQRLALSSPS